MNTTESKRRYVAGFILSGIVILSVAVMLWGYSQPIHVYFPQMSPCPPDINCSLPEPKPVAELPSALLTWIPAFTALIAAIGSISTVMLAWRSDRRDAREKELKIKQLELELEAAREKSTIPTPNKQRKKVR